MNVLLGEPWDPITQETVPSLYLADFGLASHVQTIGTRITRARGTPGYEAPEIRGQGPAAFSQKSDIYALGCILFRLCTLSDPSLVEDFNPLAISDVYSRDLLSIVSAMLSKDRQSRPTATEIKQYLMAHIHENISPTAKECRTCRRVFLSINKFRKHSKAPKHVQGQNETASKAGVSNSTITERLFSTLWTDDAPHDVWTEEGPKFRTKESLAKEKTETRIKKMAGVPDDRIVLIPDDYLTDDKADPTPCAVCLRQDFESKKAFFQHLHRVHHYRNPKYVYRRLVESNFFLEGPEEPTLLPEDTPESNIKGLKARKRGYEDDNYSIGPKRQKQRT
ncbi:kinase-like protein [Melanomma pulvis-pyrius CBS 109.77]|uniref:non-specific serine/threonine protein kinase n=1 Tax=Melanomma pulvis-pyrius CBS 109.77 TaxID=1314802 RepID=A0A6A6WYE0_9PLEO|nr:kinase-like protein [Melanomma pulvis-pyrius CBS 109.77]